ncbi:hypothetical protein [Leucobacter sp. BZR 635]
MRGRTGSFLSILRTRSHARIVALAAVGGLLLSGCTGDRGTEATTEWQQFGPFEISAAHASEAGLDGEGQVRLPNGAVATLDAEALLGSGRELAPLPGRDDYTITAEHYSYTFDGDEPVFVGVVQTRHTMHYRGYTEDEFVTFVLGISAEEHPRELSRTRVLRGGEHTATIAGRSDQGVIAVQLAGALNTNVPHDSRVIGVDAIRATEVWGKDHGYPRYGDGIATFYLAGSADVCAAEVQRYDVANGLVESAEQFANTDVATGGTCVTAASG